MQSVKKNRAKAAASDPNVGSRVNDVSPHTCLKVLHVTQSVAGGIASYFEEIAAHQSSAFGQANVKFLVPSGSGLHLPTIAQEQLIFFSSASRQLGPLLNFARVTLQTIEHFRPDVVHLHSSFAGAVRTFLARHRDRPKIVYCPHGWAFGTDASHVIKHAYAVFEKHLAKFTDVILVNSEYERALSEQYGMLQKIEVVQNGIGWAHPPCHRPSTDRLAVAFIGRHDRQKGLDVLLDTLERFILPHIHFHVVGEPVRGKKSVVQRNSTANLTFHGWLDRAAADELLRGMDAVVMPSRWEAFGLVAIEAMRAGVPVIASNRGALPEVVQDGKSGYIFDLDDPNALGRLLMRIARSELSHLGAVGRTRWEEKYVADQMNFKLESVYRRLIPELDV